MLNRQNLNSPSYHAGFFRENIRSVYNKLNRKLAFKNESVALESSFFANLPIEMLVAIFASSPYETLLALSSTCRYFNGLIKAELNHEKFELRYPPQQVTDRKTQAISKNILAYIKQKQIYKLEQSKIDLRVALDQFRHIKSFFATRFPDSYRRDIAIWIFASYANFYLRIPYVSGLVGNTAIISILYNINFSIKQLQLRDSENNDVYVTAMRLIVKAILTLLISLLSLSILSLFRQPESSPHNKLVTFIFDEILLVTPLIVTIGYMFYLKQQVDAVNAKSDLLFTKIKDIDTKITEQQTLLTEVRATRPRQ